MATANTLATLDGLMMERFGDKLENLVPEITYFQRTIPFSKEKALGKLFRQTVILGREHGCSYLRGGQGLKKLSAARAGQTLPAEVTSYQNIWRFQADYESIFKSEDRAAAFDNAIGVVASNGLTSARDRLEDQLMWGQSTGGYGRIATMDQSANWVTIVESEWAEGIWSGKENAYVEFWSADLTTPRTGSRRAVKLTGIDPTTRKLFFDDLPTDLSVGDGSSSSTTGGDIILFSGLVDAGTLTECPERDLNGGSPAWNVMPGFDRILRNTSTLWGIDASAWQLWKSVYQSAGGVELSFDTLLAAFAKTQFKGGTGEYVVTVNPITFANTMSDQASMRRYDKADSPASYVVGANDITFYTQGGSMKIISHPKMKLGYFWGLPIKKFKRGGSTDITFKTANMSGVEDKGVSQFFFPLSEMPGVEFRAYSDQYLFTHQPALSFWGDGIINTTT